MSSLWQSLAYREYAEALGKETRLYALTEEGAEVPIATALVIIDRTSLRLTVWEIPRGPLGEEREALLEHLIAAARSERALVIFSSPPEPLNIGRGTACALLHPSGRTIHGEATRIVDLARSEEEILAQMKPKGRYNISVAQKHGVTVEQSQDIDAFYGLVKETTHRDKFTAPPLEHYRTFLTRLAGSFLLLAFPPPSPNPNPNPIAGLLGVCWNQQGIYYYGASQYAHRAVMAPYLLQWEAIRLCKHRGCTSYDLLGIAPAGASANHPWQGISSFKEKFGGTVRTYPPEQAAILRPWTERMLRWKRRMVG